jgi:hypothetical protein
MGRLLLHAATAATFCLGHADPQGEVMTAKRPQKVKRPQKYTNPFLDYVKDLPPHQRAAGRFLYGGEDVAVATASYGYIEAGDLTENKSFVCWIEALENFKRDQLPTPLAALVRSSAKMPEAVPHYLADLWTRYNFTRKPKTPPATAYELKFLASLKELDEKKIYSPEWQEVWRASVILAGQRPSFANLIERYNFSIPAGRPQNPNYDLTAKELEAIEYDAELLEEATGDTIETVAKKIALEKFPFDKDENSVHPKPATKVMMLKRHKFQRALMRHRNGSDYSAHRMKKRRPKINN